MAQAVELSSPYIVASPPQQMVDLNHASQRFGELLAIGAVDRVVPSMEFLGFVDGINSVAAAWTIAEGTGNPLATVVADVFHMIRGGGSVDDLLLLPGDRLACFISTISLDIPIPSPRRMRIASWSGMGSPISLE